MLPPAKSPAEVRFDSHKRILTSHNAYALQRILSHREDIAPCSSSRDKPEPSPKSDKSAPSQQRMHWSTSPASQLGAVDGAEQGVAPLSHPHGSPKAAHLPLQERLNQAAEEEEGVQEDNRKSKPSRLQIDVSNRSLSASEPFSAGSSGPTSSRRENMRLARVPPHLL